MLFDQLRQVLEIKKSLDLVSSSPKDAIAISVSWQSFMTKWFTIQDIFKNTLYIVC